MYLLEYRPYGPGPVLIKVGVSIKPLNAVESILFQYK